MDVETSEEDNEGRKCVSLLDTPVKVQLQPCNSLHSKCYPNAGAVSAFVLQSQLGL